MNTKKDLLQSGLLNEINIPKISVTWSDTLRSVNKYYDALIKIFKNILKYK